MKAIIEIRRKWRTTLNFSWTRTFSKGERGGGIIPPPNHYDMAYIRYLSGCASILSFGRDDD